MYLNVIVTLFWYLREAPEHEIRKLRGLGHNVGVVQISTRTIVDYWLAAAVLLS